MGKMLISGRKRHFATLERSHFKVKLLILIKETFSFQLEISPFILHRNFSTLAFKFKFQQIKSKKKKIQTRKQFYRIRSARIRIQFTLWWWRDVDGDDNEGDDGDVVDGDDSDGCLWHKHLQRSNISCGKKHKLLPKSKQTKLSPFF